MVEVEEIIKDKIAEVEKKIEKAKKLIGMAKEVGIDTTKHEIELRDYEEKIKRLKKYIK